MKEYEVHVTPVVMTHDEKNRKGYIVTRTLFVDGEPASLLSKKLFVSPESSFWEGFHIMESEIEEDYETYLRSRKKLRRRKTNDNFDTLK